ncbi:MAG: hypothetical protein HY875_11725 [Chloroflexi bacterium]|nr:hypothetical protein [Chloroflexota bacterium]
MFVADWLVELLFGTLYGGVVMVIALLAAIPYGLWQGWKRLWSRRPGGHRGNS